MAIGEILNETFHRYCKCGWLFPGSRTLLQIVVGYILVHLLTACGVCWVYCFFSSKIVNKLSLSLDLCFDEWLMVLYFAEFTSSSTIQNYEGSVRTLENGVFIKSPVFYHFWQKLSFSPTFCCPTMTTTIL